MEKTLPALALFMIICLGILPQCSQQKEGGEEKAGADPSHQVSAQKKAEPESKQPVPEPAVESEGAGPGVSAPDLSGPRTGPYKVLDDYYAAIGGFDKVFGVKTEYSEGTVSIDGGQDPVKGTFKQWRHYPFKYRQEIETSKISQVSGDNGEIGWVVVLGGLPQLFRREDAVKAREVEGLLASHRHLEVDSKVFELALLDKDKVDGVECDVVEIRNTVNSDVRTQYFDAASHLLVKEVLAKPSSVENITHSDYRETGGISRPYKRVKETVVEAGKQTSTIEMTKVEINAKADPELFEIPPRDPYAF